MNPGVNGVDSRDARDIRATLEGDESAFARLVERYEAQVFAQMWRYSRDRRILEELVQDVFVEVFTSLARFRGDAPFIHWVRRIATRVGFRHWKIEHRARRRAALLAQQPPPRPAMPESLSPSESGELLFRMLECLVPMDRLALTLHYFEDCDSQEIARRTGWSPTLVRVRMHRACRRLRRLLTEAGYAEIIHE